VTVTKLNRTTFQDDVSFRFDLLNGDLLAKVVRELSKDRRFLPNVSKDEQSKAWIWRGQGTEKHPWYWVKVFDSSIVIFSGFFAGASNWSQFRRNTAKALLEALSGVEANLILNLTSTYTWHFPNTQVGKEFPALMTFSHNFLPANLNVIERFSTLLYEPETKVRCLFDGALDAASNEFKFSLSVQSNRMEQSAIANLLDDHFAQTDSIYQRANAMLESIFPVRDASPSEAVIAE
jgi:hypothetical protein